MTLLRIYIHETLGDTADKYITRKDESHLNQARPVIRIIQKHGLRIFGTKQHAEYDVGIVSFSHRLLDGGCGFRERPQPEDYEDSWEYEDALDEWCEEEEMQYGDLDRPIPAENAYKKILAIAQGKTK
jgi:hypothetical protein